MKQVSKDVFHEYLKNYPSNKLSLSITRICEPNIEHVNDKVTGVEVARTILEWLGSDGEIDDSGTYYEYYVKEA